VKEGWEHFLHGVRDRKVTRVTKCTTCQIKSMCGMCPATAYLETGDPEEPVDFLCHTAHLRSYTFGLAVPPHGDCEYCSGGASHSVVMQEVARLRAGSAAPRPPAMLPDAASSSALPDSIAGCAGGCCAH
jgi:hypothetical protein